MINAFIIPQLKEIIYPLKNILITLGLLEFRRELWSITLLSMDLQPLIDGCKFLYKRETIKDC